MHQAETVAVVPHSHAAGSPSVCYLSALVATQAIPPQVSCLLFIDLHQAIRAGSLSSCVAIADHHGFRAFDVRLYHRRRCVGSDGPGRTEH